EDVAHRWLGIVEKRGTAVAVGFAEVWAGTTRHQLVFECTVLHNRNFLAAYAFLVDVVAADQRLAVVILCARIIDDRYAGWQHTRVDSRNPIALTTKAGEHLFHHRAEGYRWTGSAESWPQHLREQRRRCARLEKHGSCVVLRCGRCAKRHQFAA